ncbi:helix-turn-helix domain-containing protein [Haloferax sp. Q22]|uniref:helix-turn-helix domain-containing protein n=1 Tax=Haloferax sp. (strain Q22) TaxID=1526048 RepID=UPI000737AFAE|nr:helix-turn-helix domain-containing protein [Haloferax sp. Q22]
MLIAEFTIDHPILLTPLREIPDIEVKWEETYRGPDDRTQMLFSVRSDDFAAVERALADDRSVTNPTVLDDTGDRRFYRVDFTPVGDETNLMPEFISVGGVLQRAVGTNNGWRCHAQFPSRDAFRHIMQFCRDHEIDISVKRLYEETYQDGPSVSLTDAQRELLVEAAACGYLEIPRTCSLADLGDRLDISDSSASERFRRGVRQLIQQTVLNESTSAQE